MLRRRDLGSLEERGEGSGERLHGCRERKKGKVFRDLVLSLRSRSYLEDLQYGCRCAMV